jgi:molybdate transport system substrate-binding protein
VGRTLLTLAAAALTTALMHAQAPLRVIASNGVKTFVEALVPAYEKSSGRQVSVRYGTSSTLVKDIVGGAPFDVVIATAEAVDQISKAGRVTTEPVTVLGRSQVGVGVRQGSRTPRVGTAAGMKQALLDAKGVTYAGNGASRPGIEKMFATLGVADALKAKTILGVGSDGSIELVHKGEADLLLTLVSEILPAPGIELVGPLPQEFRSEVVFAAAVSATAADTAAARALITSLISRESTATLRAKGLER